MKGAFANEPPDGGRLGRSRRQTRRRPRLPALWPQPGRAKTLGLRLANPSSIIEAALRANGKEASSAPSLISE